MAQLTVGSVQNLIFGKFAFRLALCRGGQQFLEQVLPREKLQEGFPVLIFFKLTTTSVLRVVCSCTIALPRY